MGRRSGHASRGLGKIRFIVALVMLGFAVLSYFGKSEVNPVTGATQRIAMTPNQEIAIDLKAVPQMAAQYGGIYPSEELQNHFDQIGHKLLRNSQAGQINWNYDFHLLADEETVNVFALPGGQIFITYALYSKLKTEGQLAGVLGHEIAHVVARHSAQRVANQNLTQGLLSAVLMGTGSQGAGQIAQMIGNVVNMKYGRGDELESDQLGIQFMAKSNYDPRSMIGVMKILKAASGGASKAEFFSTHPDPENRVGKIMDSIQRIYPNGVTTGLTA